jgi:hypothetical protein
MATKPKLNDMSIDPSTLKGKKEPEVTSSDSKGPKTPKVLKEKRPSHHKGHGKQKPTVCIKNGKSVQKVARKEAAKLVEAGWAYCSRSEWRKSLK